MAQDLMKTVSQYEADITTALRQEIASLKLVVSAYNSVADKLIAKVESGRARSRETYPELKTARQLARTELGS